MLFAFEEGLERDCAGGGVGDGAGSGGGRCRA